MEDKNRFRVKKRKKKRNMLLIILLVLLVSVGYYFLQLTKVQTVEIKQDDQSLGITKEEETKHLFISPTVFTPDEKIEDIVHIALFGVDRRDKNEIGRADTIMIATIDYKHNKVKLTSLMRDLYVEVEGYGKTKLNHAYAYGGAELAIKTINQNFGTDIRDYATVDFFTLEAIINEVGGVEIDIKDDEVSFVNQYMKETANIQEKEVTSIQRAGKQYLNGLQAVSYARIRYVGDGDFERTERQRNVLKEMIEEVKGSSRTEMASLSIKVLPYIETSLSRSDMMSLVYEYVKQSPFSIEEMRFPLDGKWKGTTKSGVWVMESDIEEMKETIGSYLYEDIRPSVEKIPYENSQILPRSKAKFIYKDMDIS